MPPAIPPPCTAHVSRVVITGGTHGDERCGVTLARHFIACPALFAHHNFSVQALLANPAAVAANTRYIDEDLNRCFLQSSLTTSALRQTLESRRAVELNALLGPKHSPAAADLVIDLHNTTSATGVALMLPPNDDLAHAIAARLTSLDPSVRLCNWDASQTDYPMLPSVAKHGLTLEVGPVAHGMADDAVVRTTRRLVLAALDYVDAHNAALAARPQGPWRRVSLLVHAYVRAVDYPRGAHGEVVGMVHPRLQGRDFEAPLREGDAVFMKQDGTTAVLWEEENGDEEGLLVPFFINEAAYVEKKIAFMLARRFQRPVQVAQL